MEDSFELDMYNPRRDDIDIQKYVQVEGVLKAIKAKRDKTANDSARAKFAAWDSQSSPPPAKSPKNKIENARNKFEAWLNSSSPPPSVSPSNKKGTEQSYNDESEEDNDASMFFFVPLADERKVERPSKLVSRRSYIAPPPGALSKQMTTTRNVSLASNTAIDNVNSLPTNVPSDILYENQNIEQTKIKKRKKRKGDARWDRLMKGIPSQISRNTNQIENKMVAGRKQNRVPKPIIMPMFR